MFQGHCSLCRKFIHNPPWMQCAFLEPEPVGTDWDVHVFLFLSANTVNHACGLWFSPVIYCCYWRYSQRSRKHQKLIHWVNADRRKVDTGSLTEAQSMSFFPNSLTHFTLQCWQISIQSKTVQAFRDRGYMSYIHVRWWDSCLHVFQNVFSTPVE